MHLNPVNAFTRGFCDVSSNRLCPFPIRLEGCTHVIGAKLTAECPTQHTRTTKRNVRLVVSRYETTNLCMTERQQQVAT